MMGKLKLHITQCPDDNKWSFVGFVPISFYEGAETPVFDSREEAERYAIERGVVVLSEKEEV